jgi:hypothetical protein
MPLQVRTEVDFCTRRSLRQLFRKLGNPEHPRWNLLVTTNTGAANLSIHLPLYKFLPCQC